MEEKLYSVSEAVRLIGVESHVLRYWEEELHIEIQRTSQGHRIYSAENIEMFRQVRELKEKGIQLKAIRVLLEETEPTEEQAKIREQIETFRQRTAEDTQEVAVVMPQAKPDNLQQFEVILKQMLTEVVEEQNEKLEAAILQLLRSEMEELYLRYVQSSMEEAAASSETKTGIWQKIWNCIRKRS